MMKTSQKTKLTTAMAVALGATVPWSAALAVNLSDNGLGEVGIIPYYTARNGLDTYLSVVNTSTVYTSAVKVRFREGANSRDARDFNIFLSPNDVWTGVVTMGTDGETPVLKTGDSTCTAPAMQDLPTTPADGLKGVPFTAAGYDGSSADFPIADTGSTSIERAQEGHIEVIEMGVSVPREPNPADPVDEGNIAWWAEAGECAKIVGQYQADQTAFGRQFDEPLNIVKVAGNLQALTAGASGGIPVTTLANFFNPNVVEDATNPASDDLMREPASVEPNLNSAAPPIAQQVTNLGIALENVFADGADAVSSLMMADAVINEYAVGGAADAQYQWVVTFPTKNLYVDSELCVPTTTDPLPCAGAPRPAPFEYYFQDDSDGDGKSCITVAYNYYDRSENAPGGSGDLDFSPRPPGVPGNAICQEAQTLDFGTVNALGSQYDYGVPLASGFTNGWMRLRFTKAGTISSLDGTTFTGLPVLGFGLKILQNAAIDQGVLRNYAILTPHAYHRNIQTQ